MTQDMHNNMKRNNEITARARRDYGSCPTRLRLVMTLLLVLLWGISEMWGQTTYTYYALHCNGKGYLKQYKGIVGNDATFRHLTHDDNGSSMWVYSSDGYLQQEMYYLNVLNGQTLVLSTTPVTKWDLVTDGDKNRFQMNGSTKILGFDGSKVVLAENPTYKYAACTLTVTENNSKWEGPKDVSWEVQSPQLVTYLRTYYLRNITVKIDKNDAGTENVQVANGDSRCYCSLTYSTTSDANKGTKWDINETTGVIRNISTDNKQQSVTATYTLTPLNPIVLKDHPATTAAVTIKVNAKAFSPDASKKYLLFNTQDNNYRFPKASSTLSEGNLLPVNGKQSDLTETVNGDITWIIETDAEGFCLFKNVTTNTYLYYDAADYTVSDYGAVKMGSATPGSDTRYKFRLYSGCGNRDPFGGCYYIIPYEKQFAVWKKDGVLGELYFTLYMNTSNSTKIASIYKTSDNAKWKIYAYEWEYRLWDNWSISGNQDLYATGNYPYTASTWFSRNIIGSPTNAEHLMLPNSKTHDGITYTWTLTGLDDYISTSDVLASGTSTMTASVNSLPPGTRTGTLTVKASISSPASKNNSKTITVTLNNLNPTFTEVSSLSQITDASGLYKLTTDNTYSDSNKPSVTTFSGTLDGGSFTISGLSAPLFQTLDGGTVRNVNFDNVNISSGNDKGDAGTVCSEARGSSRIYNVGVLATGSTVTTDNDGYTKISSCSSTVSGSRYVGGLVGLLDGEARVINCFSYADIKGGTDKGGIVGYNNYATNKNNLRTMVMNCMFYGDIVSGGNIAPIYAGNNISNKDNTGVGNFNYFRAEAPYAANQLVNVNNGNSALMAETRFLQRFEFFRHLLNGHRELAAWWATGDVTNKDKMLKWVMEPSQIGSTMPYPVLKAQGYYPSVVNLDADNASTTSERNKGGKLGTLNVTIEMGDGEQFERPEGAAITNSSLTLNITDKDPEHFNFNYYKMQLPYYNDVGTKNYTGNRVVVGWMITSITGGTAGSFSVPANDNTPADAPYYNYADRNCTNKDLYSVSGRIFNQGDYWDVPEGVTDIIIKPYWAKAAYVADDYRDVVYNTGMGTKYNVGTVAGGQWFTNNTDVTFTFKGEPLTLHVYSAISNAVSALSIDNSYTVNDYAVVLVGNYHHYSGNNVAIGGSKVPYTVTSVDFDEDNEPDYSLIMRFDGRAVTHPVKYDFLCMPGFGMAQKSTGGSGSYNFGILKPDGWFEVTNTALFRVTQMEYSPSSRAKKPIILHGGVIEQWVSSQGGSGNDAGDRTSYFYVGDNVWFKEFHIGVHQDHQNPTPHPPMSVTGGDYDEFYLTGLYQAAATNYNDNAECYINGGRFGIVAGAGMEGIGHATNHTNGNITWQIDHADMDEFYGGGINAAKPLQGNISTTISNSHVRTFCGGPKFGDMESNRTVTTNATNCTFGTYFGAGYGGTSYSRYAPKNKSDVQNVDWNAWVRSEYKQNYNSTYQGVSTQINYQFIPMSGNASNVARLWVEFAKFSLATTHGVTSNLTGCTVTGNFYGGGSLGKVDGNVTSTLNNCTVNGSAFGAGYSASLPTVEVDSIGFRVEPLYYSDFGTYRTAVKGETTTYEWKHANSVNSDATAIDKKNHILYTTEDLTTLGTVTGKATLNIEGTTTVAGSVYGGGEESAVGGDTEVNVSSGTIGTTGEGGAEYGNVFGGGKGKKKDANTDDTKAVTAGLVKGNTNVNINGGAILHNIYGGGAFGSVGDFNYSADNTISGYTSGGKCTVTVTGGTIGTNGDENGMVFGSSRGDVGEPGAITDKQAWVYDTEVVIGTQSETPDLTTPLIRGTVYGGGENGHNYHDAKVTIHSGTIGIASGEKITKGGHDYEGPRYPYRGNVYGGGCGTDTYTGTDNLTNFNFKAGIVQGNATVEMDGGHVLHNIYGGGAMGSVGTYSFNDSDEPTCTSGGLCTVTITGGDIGGDNMTMKASDGPDDFGHVFGAGRGDVIDKAICPNIEKVAYYNNTALTIKGTAFVRGSVYGGSESGHVLNDTHVVIGDPITETFSGSECQIGNGDGVNQRYTSEEWEAGSSATLKPTNHWDYVDDGNPYDQNVVDQGKYMDGTSARGGQKVASDGHTFYGNVFGGGSGYYPYAAGEWLFTAGRVGGKTHVEINSGHILNNVYGGCEMSDVTGSATVEMKGGTVGVPRTRGDLEKNPSFGHIFGAGMGDKRTFFNEVTNIASSVVNVSGGRVYGSVYGGGEDGHILGNAVTTITGGTIGSNAKTSDIEAIFAFDGNVFGGGQGSPTALTAGTIGGNATLNVQGGTMLGSAYGGGRIASVGTFFADANDTEKYGKMQEGDDHGIITVNLTGGTIENNVYGGCMGTLVESAAVEQNRFAISKKVTVKLNEGKVNATDKGCVVKGSIFGCNNVNSSPQEDVEVYIWATQNAAASQIAGIVESTDQKVLGRYDVKGVYGGGNMAAYKPNGGKTTTYSTHVTIDGCDLTSIEQVYGGGNAASTPATEVTVNGTFEIGELFGGGNGKDKISYNGTTELDNPGANVGFYAYEDNITSETATTEKPASDTPESRADNYGYGDGVATVNIFGGLIHSVFGGSNTKGNVKETAITLLEEKKQENSDEACCPFRVDEVYGGGKSAPMDAEAKMYMACIPGLTAAYGGAEAADIQGGVTLNITNGRFDRVFGGNNKSGTIRGPIEVNIEETGCRPIIIGELYGGGNLAPYSVYGYNSDGSIIESGINPLYKDPVVNVKSFTSIGNVFGGGYGSTATMVGNPTVNINVAMGDKATHSEATIGENAMSHENGFPIPSHVSGKIGAINNVYGGGNEAMVKGNTKVNIGTTEYEYTLVNKELTVGTTDVSSYYTRTGEGTSADPYVYTKCAANSTAAANTTYYERKAVIGADIRGNVYGGGNNADVTGNTEVIIGKEKTQ